MKGTQGVKANLAFRSGNFLPAAYQEELKKDNGNAAHELKSKQHQDGQAECRMCCE